MLKEFYEANKVPDGDQIKQEKNILLVVPEKGFDTAPILAKLELTKYEVAVTWPKSSVDMTAEVTAAEAFVIVQVGQRFFDDLPFVPDDGVPDDELMSNVWDCITDHFVALHHHDEYSIKDGLGTVDHLINLLAAQRRSFCCITNHGSVGGWIRQYNACKKAGVKAIFGCEFYISDYRGDDPEVKKAHRSANHLVLLAQTKEGFDNIIRIHNDAQLNGFYYSPRADWASLKKWGKGIVGMSSCCKGEIAQALMADDKDKAHAAWECYSGAFDQFYIELQIIECEDQKEINRRLIGFAREVGAPMVVSCDSHYMEPEQADTHDLLLCIRQGKSILDKQENDSDVWNFDVRNLYYRNFEELQTVFLSGFKEHNGTERGPFLDDVFTQEVFDEAVRNTRRIATGAEDIVLDSSIKLPKLYPDGATVLWDKAQKGFVERWEEKLRSEESYREREKLSAKPSRTPEEDIVERQRYEDRLLYEYGIITKMGWTDYFLIMEKIIHDTVEKYGEFAIGYGRGSAAGSLVSYCLRLTDVDPLEWGLLFERFLDESRTKDPPDIDSDFDPNVRDWVKQHIVEVFGADNVCSIGTYQTYRTRAVILDVTRALGLELAEAAEVTKSIDPLKSFEDDEGEDTKVDKLDFNELCFHYPELKTYFEKYPEVRHHAEVLRNQVKNMGTHAGGVIISDGSLKDKIPVLYDKASNAGRKVISAWAESGSSSELSSVGLVKYDILGLTNLPVISDCIGLIVKHHPGDAEKVRRVNIPINDRESILFGSKKDLVGIFQLESPATRDVILAVGMESLNDVAAVTSLIRPGPKDLGMDMEYARRKHSGTYEMPEFLRELWKETYGILTYQEQCCTGDCQIWTTDGMVAIRDIVVNGKTKSVYCLNDDGDRVVRGIVQRHRMGKKMVYRVVLDNGMVLTCTEDEKVMTQRGWIEVANLREDDEVVTSDSLD